MGGFIIFLSFKLVNQFGQPDKYTINF